MPRIIILSRNYVPIINKSVNPFRTIQAIHGTGGDGERPIPKKYMCSICDRNFNVNNKMLYPRKCLNENINPHPICRRCWFKKSNGFANEDENHACPGCVRGLPNIYYGLTREERRKLLENFKLKPTDEVFDLTDDSIVTPQPVKREPRKYTVIELIDLSKDSDSDEEPSYKKQKLKEK
jgi:hypothetical protein